MLILEENFRRHLEAFASELFISLLLLLKTVVLLYVFLENMIHFILGFLDDRKVWKYKIDLKYYSCVYCNFWLITKTLEW